jgi:hypothetical protein
MSRRTGLFWDAIAGRRPIPRAAASPGWKLMDADPARGTIQVALTHDFVPVCTVPRALPRPAPRAACDHGAPAGWQLQSTHRTSEGTVAYARCRCGASLVLLEGQPLAGHPRPRAATPPVGSGIVGDL